jgi:hypothetical protein
MCGTKNYPPSAMFIDTATETFIGQCCLSRSNGYVPVTVSPFSRPPMQVIPMPIRADDVEYGFEVSNKVGVRAYVNYAGLSLQFDKSPTEIRDWALKNGILEPKAVAVR